MKGENVTQYKNVKGIINVAGFDTAGGKPVVRGICEAEGKEYAFTLWLDKVNDRNPEAESPFSRTARALRAAGLRMYGNPMVPRDQWFRFDSDESGNPVRNTVRITLSEWIDKSGKARWGAKYIDPIASLEVKSAPSREALDALFSSQGSAKSGTGEDKLDEDIPF